jgi:hypothetical protein
VLLDTGQVVQARRDQPARHLSELAAAGHDRSDQLRQPDHGAGVRLALRLVGVQQVLGKITGQNS